jgi:transposase-like protein
MILNILNLIDDVKCFETVRQMRWPDGVTCPQCASPQVTKQGHDEIQPARQKYECTACRRRFDDLTGTIFAGHHRPLRTWITCLYFMGLNLSNEQIAQELDLNGDNVQKMTSQLREGIVKRTPEVTLSGAVECDEVYVTAGHKGHSEAVKKRANGAAAPVEGGARPWDAGEGETADLRDDRTHRSGRHPDAGERQASDDRAADPTDDRKRHCGLHR